MNEKTTSPPQKRGLPDWRQNCTPNHALLSLCDTPKSVEDTGYSKEYVYYDMASRNYVVAIWSVRCPRRRGYYYVGQFLTQDVEAFASDTAVKVGILQILNQASLLTTRMEIRFGEAPLEQKEKRKSSAYESRIPEAITAYAAKYGVTFRNVDMITHEEAETLFVRMLLSPKAVTLLEKAGIDPVKAASLLLRNVWSNDELLYIACYSKRPSSIIYGSLVNAVDLLMEGEKALLRSLAALSFFRSHLVTCLNEALGFNGANSRAISCKRLSLQVIGFSSSLELEIPSLDGGIFLLEPSKAARAYILCCETELYSLVRMFEIERITDVDFDLLVVSRDFLYCSQETREFFFSLAEQKNFSIATLQLRAGELDAEARKRVEKACKVASEKEVMIDA